GDMDISGPTLGVNLGLQKLPFPPRPHLRKKRYTLTPGRLKWDHFNLTYKILSFPKNLIGKSQTRKGLTAAFRMWSDVSPFTFREVPASASSDLTIGFYPINHTDCVESQIHHCFDGITGELAHAFFPQTGEIHFDDHEYWIVGDTRFSWKKVVWLTDLVHVAAHEIGHALGLMHSLDPNALMHVNATLTGKNTISQDEMWGIYRLYGKRLPSVARRKERRLQRPNVYMLIMESERILSNTPTVYEKALPLQLVPFSDGDTHPATAKDEDQARARRPERYFPIWYKEKELLEYSYPGYLFLNGDHMSIIANAINEGTYTCIVKKKSKILTTYSWRVRLKH
ncbi:hypothetical protein E2320_006225, partial [Naja naja]